MWLTLPDGFYSAVADRNDPTWLVVRARTLEHITRLAARLDGHVTNIVSTPLADYPYRLWVLRDDFDALLSAFVQDELTYDNFKSAAARADFGDVGALHKVWAVMRETEADREPFDAQPGWGAVLQAEVDALDDAELEEPLEPEDDPERDVFAYDE